MDSTANNSDVQVIQENYYKFCRSFMLLLYTLSNDVDCKESRKMLNNVERFIGSMEVGSRIVKKIFLFLVANFELLENRDGKLFGLHGVHNGKVVKVSMISGIDIGSKWDVMIGDTKNKIWNYLNNLYISSSNMITHSGNDCGNEDKIARLHAIDIGEEFNNAFPDHELCVRDELDLFVGVGREGDDYGLEDLSCSTGGLEKEKPNPTALIGKFMNKFGMQSESIDTLMNQLKNISHDDIIDMGTKVKQMLDDEQAESAIDIVFNSFAEEIKSKNIDMSNPFSGIYQLADSIATKAIPAMQASGQSPAQLKKIMSNMMNKFMTQNGDFANSSDPMAQYVNKMASALNKKMENIDNDEEETDNEDIMNPAAMFKMMCQSGVGMEEYQNCLSGL